MITLVGAGAVGLVLGARLARAGEDVVFVTRRPDAAARLARDGVHLEDPASGEATTSRVRAVAGVADAAGHLERGPVLFCMRATDTPGAAADVARVAPGVAVAGLQNDVEADGWLAQHFTDVSGIVVRQTCTRTAPNAAAATGTGRLVVGPHPEGTSRAATDLARRLRAAGYDVGVSTRLVEDRWLKLCINLMSAPNALIRRPDHTSEDFVEIKTRLLEEARDVLAAAGILARSCDGRDRSLDEEIAFQRTSLQRGTSARPLPLYNQVWSALQNGGPLEADGYHRRILALAAGHGVAAPQNERMLAALEAAVAAGRGPERARAADLRVGARGAAP